MRVSNYQYLVPSPMSEPLGKAKNGNLGPRTLSNTGKRRFLVVEFDKHSIKEQALLINHLSKMMPLVIALHSGGKSLHAWFYCENTDASKLEKFMRYVVSIGGDPATWTPCQMVRTPNAFRDNGNQQKVIYLNWEAIS